MRILHCLYDHEKNPWVGGGATHRLAVLRRHLEQMGHQIQVISGAFPGCEQFKLDAGGFQFVGNPSSYLVSTFSYARAARRFVLRHWREYDLVIEDFAPWNPLFISRRNVGPKLIELQSHLGGQILKRYWLAGLPFYRWERVYPGQFAHRISISKQIGNYPDGVTEMIPNGVDPAWLKLDAPEGDYIAFMGRLDFKIKGIDTLLQAVRTAKLPLKIAGDGEERDRLQREIAGLEGVEWVGWLDGPQMIEFLRHSRFVVAPSRSEGQNMIVMNAAALGKPSVVSDIGGLRYVTDAGFGLAFPVDSAEALATQMNVLWENDEERRRLGAAARVYARELTWPELANKYANFCHRVVDDYRAANRD